MTEKGRSMEANVYHPGVMVAEYLEFNEWNQRELARRSGLTPKTISEICSGKARISATTALALEKVFRRPAHFWLNLQTKYDEVLARQDAASDLVSWEQWVNRFPIAAMKRFGFLAPVSGETLPTANALLRFFGVSSPSSWQTVWDSYNIAYRQTTKFSTTVEACSAWLRAVELEANAISTSPYDERVLLSTIPELRKLTKERPEVFVPEVQRLCAAAGVAVAWVPELPKTGISGCSRWISDFKAMVGLTLRYKWDDQIWFTFFHELGHVILHKKRHLMILDNATKDIRDKDVDPEMQQLEEEANRFAADTLIPPVALSQFIKRESFTVPSVLEFAGELNIGPGVVIGRLQREGLLKYSHGNSLKRRFQWTVKNN